MYACIPEIGRGFFAGVCAPSNATAHSCDPPPPPHTSRIDSSDASRGKGERRKFSLASSLFEAFTVAPHTPHRRRRHPNSAGRSSLAQTPSVLLHGSRSLRSQGRFPRWAVGRLVGFRLAPHTPHHHHHRRGSAGRSGLARTLAVPPRAFRSLRSRGYCLPHSQDWPTEMPLEIQARSRSIPLLCRCPGRSADIAPLQGAPTDLCSPLLPPSGLRGNAPDTLR